MSSTSEKTFGNLLQKAREAVDIVTAASGYKPDNDAIKLTVLTSFLDSVEQKNDEVTQKGAVLFDARAVRRDAYFDKTTGLGVRASMARDHVGGLPGGKQSPAYKRFQKLAQKIRGNRLPIKPLGSETGAGSTTQKKRVSQSEQSYGSMAQSARDLVTFASDTTGYNPANLNTNKAALGTFVASLETNNSEVATKLSDAQNAEAARYDLYNTKDKINPGLRERMRQMKSYVAGEFGRDSETYKQLTALKF